MIEIKRCYDSHCHFLGTALLKKAFKLNTLFDSKDLQKQVQEFLINSSISHLFFGFGWSQCQYEKGLFSRDILDQVFSTQYLLLSRQDGHGILTHSKTLSALGIDPLTGQGLPKYLEAYVERAPEGPLTGLFFEQGAFWLWNEVLKKNTHEVTQSLLLSQKMWLEKGFTHIRDMSGHRWQAEALYELDLNKELKIYFDQNFEHILGRSIDETIEEALYCKKYKTSSRLRVSGVKLFLDGTLGGQTASLNCCSLGRLKSPKNLSYSLEELSTFAEKIWAADLDICVHAIGDGAVEQITQVILNLAQQNKKGRTHIEHCQLASYETLKKLSSYSVYLHFQPSHWLTDKKLFETPDLAPLKDKLFLWGPSSDLGFPIFFGFDSPITEPDLDSTEQALLDSQLSGIPAFNKSWWQGHSHPDESWGSECKTLYEPKTKKTKIYLPFGQD